MFKHSLWVFFFATFLPFTAFAQWQTSGAEEYYNNPVGIGAFSSNASGSNLFLGPSSAIYFWPDLSGSHVSATANGAGFNVNAAGGLIHLWNGDTEIDGWNPASGSVGVTVRGATGTNSTAALNVTNSSSRSILFVRNDGLVGVGTNSPSDTLHVVSQSDDIADGIRVSASDYGTNGGYVILNKNKTSGSPATLQSGDSAGSEPLLLNPHGGNVGIGVTTAAQPLTVGGVIQTMAGVLFPDGRTQTVAFAPGSANSSSSGLTIGATASATSRIVSGAASVVDLNGARPAYVLHPSTGGQEVAVWSDGTGGYIDAAGNSNAANNAIIFRTASAASSYAPAEAMRIGSNGYVGIGALPDTTNRLTVNGNVNVTGTITGATVVGAVYQDVAEWVPSTEALEPGTVVVLDPNSTNHVIASHRAYDTSVAGVISANPGVILGKGGAAQAKVATLGRVRVKVDATRHAVRVGDLLVTSNTPGTAMVSEPVDIGGIKMHRPGTLIGKALEPLAGGTGEVLVLLSLQ